MRLHPSVRLHPEMYGELRDYFVDRATRRPVEVLAGEPRRLPFEPYTPVRRQILNIPRAITRACSVAGLEAVPISALWLSRRGARRFEEAPPKEAA